MTEMTSTVESIYTVELSGCSSGGISGLSIAQGAMDASRTVTYLRCETVRC